MEWTYVDTHIGVDIYHDGRFYAADPYNGKIEVEVKSSDIEYVKILIERVMAKTYYDVINSLLEAHDAKCPPWDYDEVFEQIEDYYIFNKTNKK